MTEQEVAFSIRRALDESVEHLPYRVTHRLGAAREAALARMAQNARTLGVPETASAPIEPEQAIADVAVATGGPGSRWSWRVAMIAAPMAVLALGAWTIPAWDETQTARETAMLDEAVIKDDLPIAAYVDRGFGVFIRNNRQ